MFSYISTHPSLKAAFIVALLSACLTFVCFFPTLLVALITALLLAFVLRPPVSYLEIYLGLNRSLSIAIVFFVVAAILGVSAARGIPVLLDHTKELYASFRNFPFDQKLNELVQSLSKDVPLINPQSATQRVRSYINESVQSAGRNLASSAGSAISFFIVPFVTYFTLAEGDKALKRLVERVPNKYFEMTLNVFHTIGRDLVGYLKGWILDSAIIGVLTIIGLTILGVQDSVLIGALAGVANLIPYVGVAVAATLAIVVSLIQLGNFSMLVPIAVMMLVIRGIDDTIVQPMCFAKSIDMHPLMVILVLIIGHELLGVAGLVVAIPLATVLRVSAVETYWGLKHYSITA